MGRDGARRDAAAVALWPDSAVRAQNDRMRRTIGLLALALCSATLPVFAAAPPASAPVAKLGVFLGHWEFRGKSAASAQHPATSWTWDEHCRWSSNGVFLECSFDNVWGRTSAKAGTVVQSLVVDTYNRRDHGYWHYELFAGGNGARPFISKMSVQGNTWTELAGHERITYVFTSPREVTVKIESSRDGVQWRTEDAGTGRKLDR